MLNIKDLKIIPNNQIYVMESDVIAIPIARVVTAIIKKANARKWNKIGHAILIGATTRTWIYAQEVRANVEINVRVVFVSIRHVLNFKI